jgi:hypothetical protein
MRSRLLALIALIATVAALMACAGRSPQAGIAEAQCRAAGAEAVLGRNLDDQAITDALLASGGLRTRVIRPGSSVTMDADPMRLNIEVDDVGRIRRMRCG